MIDSIQRIGVRKVALACGVAACLALGACGDSNPLADALAEAGKQINALSPGGIVPATPEYKVKVLNGVITSLKANSGRGTATQNAAALLLIAQAQAALAENPATAAAEQQRTTLHRLTAIEAALNQWQVHNASAQAARSYDPAPALAAIDTDAHDREAAIQREQAHLAEVDGTIQKLRDEAASTARIAAGRRAAQADLARQADNESAVRGEELVRQAAQVGREADALEAQAADLEAQAAKIVPVSEEIRLLIERLTRQRGLLEESRAEIRARAAAYSAAGEAARALADKGAVDAETFVRELAESEGQPTGYEEAVSGYENAAKTARQAASDSGTRGQAKLSEGSAYQSLGDVHWARAQGLARVIETLDALANAKPPLPEGARYKTMAAEARERRAAALDAATQAYQSAFEAYDAAGAKGDVQDRMQRVRERLADLAKATSGGKVDLAAQVAGAGAGERTDDGAGDEQDAPSSAPDQTTVAGTLSLLIERSKADDVEGVFALFHAADQTQRALLDGMRPFAAKFARLDKACREKFGQGLDSLAVGQQMGKGLGADEFKSLTPQDFEVSESGDTATAAHPDLGQPLPLVRVEGNWMFDFGALVASTGQMPGAANNPAAAKQMQAAMSTMMSSLAPVLDRVIADVESGTIASIQQVQQALMQGMGAALMGGAQRPPGPPGRGGG